METGKETGGEEIWHLSSHWKNQRYITGVQTTPITVRCRVGVRVENKAGSIGSALFILGDNYYDLKGCINLQNEKNKSTRKKSIICFTYN